MAPRRVTCILLSGDRARQT